MIRDQRIKTSQSKPEKFGLDYLGKFPRVGAPVDP